MRFEVPQFIEVEDKIIGPFTWKQFVYLAGGGGVALIMYLAFPFFFFLLFGIPMIALAATLAFHKINNRPFSIFLEAMFNYFTKTRLYLWRRKEEQTVSAVTAPEQPLIAAPPAAQPPEPSANNISSLAKKLEMDALES